MAPSGASGNQDRRLDPQNFLGVDAAGWALYSTVLGRFAAIFIRSRSTFGPRRDHDHDRLVTGIERRRHLHVLPLYVSRGRRVLRQNFYLSLRDRTFQVVQKENKLTVKETRAFVIHNTRTRSMRVGA